MNSKAIEQAIIARSLIFKQKLSEDAIKDCHKFVEQVLTHFVSGIIKTPVSLGSLEFSIDHTEYGTDQWDYIDSLLTIEGIVKKFRMYKIREGRFEVGYYYKLAIFDPPQSMNMSSFDQPQRM